MDDETIERTRAMLSRIPKDLVYRVTVPQAMTAFGRGLSVVEPPHYTFTEGGAGETRWLDIYKDAAYLGRYTFTPKPGGTECRLNWFDGSETTRILMLALLDFHVKEIEAEAKLAANTAPNYTGPVNAGLSTNFTPTLQTQTHTATRAASAGTTANGTEVVSFEPNKYDPAKAEALKLLLGLHGARATAAGNAAPGTQTQRREPGRPADKDYDWAYSEVEDKRRPFGEVFAEWQDTPKAKELTDPLKSLKNAIASRRKKAGKKR